MAAAHLSRAAGLIESFMAELPGEYPDRQPETIRTAAADLIGELLHLISGLPDTEFAPLYADPDERIARTAASGISTALDERAAAESGIDGDQATWESYDVALDALGDALAR